ncbi:AI-2E family transporter [Clostridium sp. DJ247]|uniref:AI-2E family transporter n=1 Tax=Clostridium sp. DJ247 TaxID=2726188 RepID=UPI00162460F7|nr:AI-2E family transporter [Clostridium sp. DJ247]MBC2580813.1 AI-2E family transporter [Clostridium sp. DJ247]
MVNILNDKVIKNLIIITLILLCVLLINKFYFIHKLIKIILKSFIVPLLISTFFYYLLKPLNHIFEKKGLKSGVSALLTLTISIFILCGVSYHFGIYIKKQFHGITKQLTNIIENTDSIRGLLGNLNNYININKIHKSLTAAAQSYLNDISHSFLLIVNYIMNTVSKIFLIIVILFYLLKDHGKLTDRILFIIPKKYKDVSRIIISDSNKVLSSYVTGQSKVALCLAIMIFIGYKIIDMPNALFLSSITFILAFIPFVGFLISMIFPVIITLTIGLYAVLKLAIVFLVVQTLKGRVVVPTIMADAMKIHPLTDIFLVIGAVALGGPIAAFTIVPIYAICKVIFKNLYKCYNYNED